MIAISSLTVNDIGRPVIYATGHTTLHGVLDSYDTEFCYVKFSGGKFNTVDKEIKGSRSVKMDTAVAVQTDPANLEFA